MGVIIKRNRLSYQIARLNIYWALISPLLLAMVLNIIPSRGLFVFKDLVFYLSLILLFIIGRSKTYLASMANVALFVVILLLMTVVFHKLEPWAIYNLRQILAPILIVIFGYNLKLNENYQSELVKDFFKILFIVLVIGIAIRFFHLWNVIDLSNYFSIKGIPVDSRGLSYMFYEPAFSYVERLASTLLDPISLGHIITCALIMLFYGVGMSGRKRIVYIIFLFVCLILTFSKGAVLQLILATFFLNKSLSLKLRILIPVSFVVLSLMLLNLDGILIHLVGLKNAVIYMNIFGHGLGMVGNYAKMFAEDLTLYYKYEISDTFLGSLLGQIGIVGMLIWLSFFRRYFFQVLIPNKTFVGAVIIVSQLLVSSISENTLNFNSFLVPGIMGSLMAYGRI